MKSLLLKLYYKVLKIYEPVLGFYNFLINELSKPPIVHSTDETLDFIVSERISVSRFGDGEFGLMNGQNLLFQPYNPELSFRLRQIIKSKDEKHIVCIPNIFSNVDWCNAESKNYWIKYLRGNRNKIYKMLDMQKEYYDTQVTRLYIDHIDKSKAGDRFRKFSDLWANREVIIVEGAKSRLGIGNNLFNNTRSLKRIICPSINAFAKYNEILAEVKKQDKSKLVLIALGPTATVLAFDLASCGIQAIDIGHIDIEYEWFLQQAKEKSPVKNKYIGEVQNGTNVDEIKDLKYDSQIISKII
ncbi:SP_1767 family glycosyltransferase [Neobacillus sp. M.A.Huq-85]